VAFVTIERSIAEFCMENDETDSTERVVFVADDRALATPGEARIPKEITTRAHREIDWRGPRRWRKNPKPIVMRTD
jgi:hypothetical protein